MPELRDAHARIDRFAERWMTLHNVPGLSMSITDRNETLLILHRGFANMERQESISPGTLFEAGSIGKSFTALCLLQLAEAGSLDLHRPASAYLPWFEVGGSHDAITVHHLLTHTAGITRGGDYAPYGQYEVWALRNTVTGGPPGTRFNYSNAGYKALGHLLEAVAGAGYAGIIRSQILGPLGMADTHPVTTMDTRDLMAQGYWPQYDDRPEPPGNPVVPAGWHEYGSGDGSIASTAADMAAYVRLFLNGADPIISTESFDLMIGKHIPVGYIPDTWYGYGLNVSDRHGFKHIDHGGLMLGHHATLMADLDNGIGVTVLTNGTLEPTEVADFTLRALRGSSGIGQLTDPQAELPEHGRVPNAADYVGTFTCKIGSFRVVAQGARLALEFDDESVPLESRGRDRFHADHPDFRLHLLTFGRSDGEVVEAFHGPNWFVNDRYEGPAEYDTPEEWNACVGHYRSHNPWYTNFRVFVRKGRLTLALPGTPGSRLAPMEDGSFRVGSDPGSPERVSFGALVDGVALRANLYNFDYYRTFTP